ncbi:MAG: alpha/beta hydrolase [Candidatus Promineifilaceae bacterium]|nr:alpha/beta hydrolase [Anaerolineaceae bacterium]
MNYCLLESAFLHPNPSRSPLLFLHGFPDSPKMWAAYVQAAKEGAKWSNGRSLYTLAFPNRQTRPAPIPSWQELHRGVLADEVAEAIALLATESPTGKIIPIGHDLGATHFWQYVRQRDGQVPFEKLVALSVGSSFRYDIWEHGLNAFTWLYQVLFSLPHAFRLPALQKLLAYLLVNVAGYRAGRTADVWRDTYHYWDGWLWPLRLPFYLLGAAYQPAFLNFDFPVLYMRAKIDRIATTRAFETAVQTRPNCQYILLDGVSHWFPEQHPQLVLAELATFLCD